VRRSYFGLLALAGDKPDPMEPDAMNTPQKLEPRKKQRLDADAGIPPTAAIIKHDNLADAYRRGAVDALRAVMIAARAALDKREAGLDDGNPTQPGARRG
jgi:hypothetical protein